MRVLLVTDWVAPRGGVETYVATVRDGLRAAGDDVRLLTSTAADPADGAPDYRAWGARRRALQAVTQVANPAAAAAVRRAVRAFRPDVAQVHMFAIHLSPSIFAALDPTPTILSVNDYKPVCPTGWKLLPDGSICRQRAGLVCLRHGCTGFAHWLRDRPRYLLLGGAVRSADRVLACSRFVQRELASGGVHSDVLTLPVPFRPEGGEVAPAPAPLFVFSGRLSEEKGVHLLLRAFARLQGSARDARLRVVGAGPRRRELERLAAELGVADAVDFRGWVTPDAVVDEIADAWALVAPSLHAEPFGLVAVEALGVGVPVIASRESGFGETVREGVGGLLFRNGDEAELARLLRAVARGEAFPAHRIDPNEVERVRAAHDVGVHVAALRGIYADVAAARPQAARR